MNEILLDGLVIMCIGMGFVLMFLCIMIWTMGIMSKVVGYLNKKFPEKLLVFETAKKCVIAKEDEIVAVAIAAVIAKS